MDERFAHSVESLAMLDQRISRAEQDLKKLRALRADLTAEIERQAPQSPTATPEAVAAVSEPSEDGVKAAERWLAELDDTKVSPPTGPALSQGPEWMVSMILLPEVRVGDRVYRPVEIEAKSIPVQLDVWCLSGPIQEAHLSQLDSHAFRGQVWCGVSGPGVWWRPERTDMDAQVEMCSDCMWLLRNNNNPFYVKDRT